MIAYLTRAADDPLKQIEMDHSKRRAAIGIETCKPFNPNKRMALILADPAAIFNFAQGSTSRHFIKYQLP